MGFLELFILAVGLSMDAFAVSVCKGLAMKKASRRAQLCCGAWFGGFQALMPLIGYFLGTLFLDAISAIDHWIAFGLLVLIGVNMLREAMGSEEGEAADADLSVKTMFILAVATSIDALFVGFTIADYGWLMAFVCAVIIAVVTFVICIGGLLIGKKFGTRLANKASVLGGVILIGIGLEIFFTGIF